MLGTVALAFSLGPPVHAAQPVLQRGYDAAVSGANLAETTLNTSNVAPSSFGLVFKESLDDTVYAQPLYVPNVAIPNKGTHNVVYVATMGDTLYAFDADGGGAPLWSANFASRVGATPVPVANFTFSGNRNIVGNLGILSTPVIDSSTNIMYLVACTLENNTMAYRLHAIDITTGAEPYGGGVLISGSYGGSTFDARYLFQRMSLALSGNQVVVGFGALELEYSGGYTGWVIAYNKQTLQQSGVFATVPTGTRGGGVWQSGRPPAVDSAGYVYLFVGNGFGSGYDGVSKFSESVLKLDPANGLKLVDWFTPGNWSALDNQDLDLASSGPMLIPGTNLLAGGGKTGDLYVLNTVNLGKFNATDSQVVQKQHISASELRGGPVYWQRSAANGGPLLYNWGMGDSVKAWPFNGTTFAASPSAVGTGGNQIFPGGILALSANGEQHGSGVLWATVATSGDAQDNPPVPGELHAFDAENVSRELWNSAMHASRDGFGNFAKFVPPLVANGKVYVATASKLLAVYGLLDPTWSSSDVGSVGVAGSYTLSNGTFTVNGSGTDIWGTADAFQFVSQPLNGDGSITARVVSQTGTSFWAKAGVMFRETLAVGSSFAAVEVTPGNGAVLQARTTTGSYAVSTQGPTTIKAPYWVRVVRAGNVFTCLLYTSDAADE